jgi:succinylarginine dihydrolase
MNWREVNFDGIVGPTHNYAGLSFGNVASAKNEGLVANPREGVLQGLQKAQHLRSLGMTQGVLPPHDRPHLATLRSLGFTGSDSKMLTDAWTSSPALVRNLMSSATMWTANAGTISPSPDTKNGKTHFTPANLAAMYHRSIEHETTGRVLQVMFPEGDHFQHHPALPGGTHMGDEGAANHNRFCSDYGDEGAALYVYGRSAFDGAKDLTFPGRQTLEASEAIARQHGLREGRAVFVRQNPAAINAGAFHNDVVAVSNKNVFFYHEEAFEDPADMQKQMRAAAPEIDFEFVEVPSAKVPLADAVKSYLFNSQLISPPGSDKMRLILPVEVSETASTKAYIEELLASNGPVGAADFLDVRQSMRNGGGPACLRLRVAVSDDQLAAMGSNSILDDALITTLQDWAGRHYRDRISGEDLGDPQLMEECFAALDELSQILKLGSVYDFQR